MAEFLERRNRRRGHNPCLHLRRHCRPHRNRHPQNNRRHRRNHRMGPHPRLRRISADLDHHPVAAYPLLLHGKVSVLNCLSQQLLDGTRNFVRRGRTMMDMGSASQRDADDGDRYHDSRDLPHQRAEAGTPAPAPTRLEGTGTPEGPLRCVLFR